MGGPANSARGGAPLERDVPQTNVRLYRELIEVGWGRGELLALRRSYDLAAELFSARFRGNGKPFLCHLVGTAAVIGRTGGDAAAVRAGLLHAAYAQGEFGTARPGPTPSARRRVRAAAGDRTEALVYAYTVLSWDPGELLARLRAGEDVDETRRTVALMRLANELEESLDLGRQLSGKSVLGAQAGPLAGLARALGHEPLGRAIERVLDPEASTGIPDELSSTRSRSFERMPAGSRRKAWIVAARFGFRLLDRVRRMLRRRSA